LLKEIIAMNTNNSFFLTLILAFLFTFCVQCPVQGQQQNDDPNWRERNLEKRQKETKDLIERLEKLQEAQKELNKLRDEELRRNLQIYFSQKENQKPLLDYGYWDLYPPGHPYGPRVENNVIILSPSSLSGKPFRSLEWRSLSKREDGLRQERKPRHD
jgi:hypothetical protein